MKTIGARLRMVRGDVIRDLYAPQLGVSRTSIANYETDKRSPDHIFITKVLELHPDINPTWLITGEGPMTRDELITPKPQMKRHEEPARITIDANGSPKIPRWENPDPELYDYIPLAKTRLSAGGGSFVLNEEIEGYYAFRNSWLNTVATSKRNLILMRVAGDSMLPTLQNGDTVMIDTGRKHIKEGAIFALRVDETVIIKRLGYRVGGKVMIISDNRQEFESYEADPSEVHILGQVIFFSRVLLPN